MKRPIGIATLAAGLALAGSSCLPQYNFVECGDGIHPTVCIVGPADGAMITEYAAGHQVEVQMVFSNVTVRPPGACEGLPNCGHVHIEVTAEDASGTGTTTCDIMGHPYNVAGASAMLIVDLDECHSLMNHGRTVGMHTITAGLFTDSHAPVSGAVTDSITINAAP